MPLVHQAMNAAATPMDLKTLEEKLLPIKNVTRNVLFQFKELCIKLTHTRVAVSKLDRTRDGWKIPASLKYKIEFSLPQEYRKEKEEINQWLDETRNKLVDKIYAVRKMQLESIETSKNQFINKAVEKLSTDLSQQCIFGGDENQIKETVNNFKSYLELKTKKVQ